MTQRPPEGKKPSVLLMDGQESLWKAGQDYLAEAYDTVLTAILDLLHARICRTRRGLNSGILPWSFPYPGTARCVNI
jgi:hypothetical protein